MAAWLPAAVSEGTFISEGAAAKVIALANLLAAYGVSFTGFEGTIGGVRCRGAKAGHDIGCVPKALPLLGDSPDVYVILDGIPAE